jgi:hypothetical protein
VLLRACYWNLLNCTQLYSVLGKGVRGFKISRVFKYETNLMFIGTYVDSLKIYCHTIIISMEAILGVLYCCLTCTKFQSAMNDRCLWAPYM